MKKLLILMLFISNFAIGQDTLNFVSWTDANKMYSSEMTVIVAPEGDNDGFIDITSKCSTVYLTIVKTRTTRSGTIHFVDENNEKIDKIMLIGDEVIIFFTKKGESDAIMFYDKK